MKLLRSYKQGISTWFEYYCLFQYIKITGLYIYKDHAQHTISKWMRSIPSITIRTKYENS